MSVLISPHSITQKKTYATGITGLVVPAAATDVFTIFGSSTKTIVVVHFEVTGAVSSKAMADVQLIKRSTANTGGTATNPAAVPMDSTNAAGTATISAYTANPTLGTSVGIIHANKLLLGVSGTDQPQSIAFNFDRDGKTQGVYLRGTGEGLCLNLNGGTFSSPSLSIDVAWYEE